VDSIKQALETAKEFIYSLNPTYVELVATLFLVVTLILATIFISGSLRSEQLKKMGNKAYMVTRQSLLNSMKASTIKSFNYDAVEQYINSSGLAYMTNYKMTPLMYIVLRIVLALFLMILGLQFNLFAGLALLPIGYFGLDFIINMSDKADNDKMLADIEDVYDTLRIQTKAGVYITSVLTDCYLVVKNKRLKSAFLKLTSDIAAKNDIDTALDDFRGKFRNEYIDTLVIIIKQSMQTGQAAKMFDDIREQIADIDAAMLINEKNSINSKIIFVQMIVYVAIIVVAVYITFISITNGLNM
jgi:pilus assembly protein TadC